MKSAVVTFRLWATLMLFVGTSSPANLQGTRDPATQEVGDFAYHDGPPSGALPKTLQPPSFATNPAAHVSYRLAARIRKVLYQEPCFCNCNRFASHKSLLDCYREDHGMSCYTCQAEAIFCYEKRHQGMKPDQIRQELYRDEWKKLDLQDYVRRFGEQRRRTK